MPVVVKGKTSTSPSQREPSGIDSSTIRSSGESYRNCDQLNMDLGRRGGAHRGAHQCDERTSLQDDHSRNDDIKTPVHHRAGSKWSSHGAGGTRARLAEQHRLLPLVSGSLWKSSSRSTRACSFLPDANRSRGSSQWPMKKLPSNDANQLSDVTFDQEVNQVVISFQNLSSLIIHPLLQTCL